jgi:hypothetical protein
MSFNPASPVTGAAQTGLTAPTYTLTTDTPPASNAKQYAITALGGTQTGVDSHSVARPFTLTMFRPTVLKSLGTPNPVTGRISQIPNNVYTVLTRKGVTPLAGQPSVTMVLETRMQIPAGSDLADPANIRAAFSLHIGAVWAQSAGLGDSAISGII